MGSQPHPSTSPVPPDKPRTTTAPAILLVDDSPEFLTLWKQRLQDAGYTVYTATGSVEAMHVAHQHRIKAAVIDLLLNPLVLHVAEKHPRGGRVHGDRLADLLSRQYPSVGIVLTTALSERDRARHGLRPDLRRFSLLSKPMEEAHVLAALRKLGVVGRREAEGNSKPSPR